MVVLLLIIRKRVVSTLRRTASYLGSLPGYSQGSPSLEQGALLLLLDRAKQAALKSYKREKAPYLKKTDRNPEFSVASESTPLESKNMSLEVEDLASLSSEGTSGTETPRAKCGGRPDHKTKSARQLELHPVGLILCRDCGVFVGTCDKCAFPENFANTVIETMTCMRLAEEDANTGKEL